ncbi:MAG: BMP family ABC transporter substrate-binding protein [Firmicutes bacterium]|nr:BMP family ABC transporter substrate-binding protein [Bacillota bacterium]
MSREEYERALKLGRRAFAEAQSKGKSPYLRVLEDDKAGIDVDSEVSLGTMDIPLERIVGTSAHGRSKSFAHNFMPILPYGTEFGMKWSSLCDHHLEEGIRHAIQVYEYMNYYYVVEGNKRVSVLKYFGAASVPAHVTRIIPRRTNTKESRIYYEFLKFYKVCQVNYIWFSQEGSYDLLLQTIGMEKEEDWQDKEAASFFRSNYYEFRSIFKEQNKAESLEITTGDAFLKYIMVFGYKDMYQKSREEVARELEQLWPELELLVAEDPIGLQTQPDETPAKRSFWGLFVPAVQKDLKVAFVHADSIEKSSWTYAHELGRTYLQDTFADHIETVSYENVPTDPETGCEKLCEIAEEGYDVIFTTSQRLIAACLKAAIRCPEVKFLNCSVHVPYQSVRTYFGRMFEAKMLIGAIAGAMTETDSIGYIADYPTASTIASINAFALGAQMMNPRAKVYLEWTALKKPQEHPTDKLKRMGADILSNQDMITPYYASKQFGVYQLMKDGTVRNIAMPVWNWGVFYKKLIQSLQSGSWDNEPSVKAINYWWGMAAGVIDVVYSQALPDRTKHLVEALKRAIKEESMMVFEGVIHNQDGEVMVPEGRILETEKIVTMDWLVENVVGRIPGIDEVTAEAASAMNPIII